MMFTRLPRGNKWALLLLAVALSAAVALTAADLRLASSQGLTLSAGFARQVPVDDPYAAVWDQATPVDIPLTQQNLTPPMGGGTIKTITARALHDGKRLYILAEWQDSTQDLSTATVTSFRDAVAIEFPTVKGQALPSFCMGQAGGLVNIWQWKADWQDGIDKGFVSIKDIYPNMVSDSYPFSDDDTFYPGRAAGNLLSRVQRDTPVENLVATGFGTLTTADQQPVQGVGRWKDGKWRVLFVRDFEVKAEGVAQFKPGDTTSVAFAAWDGSQGDRDGQKSVSQFTDLQLSSESAAGGGANNGIVIAIVVPLVVFGIIAAAMIMRRRQPA